MIGDWDDLLRPDEYEEVLDRKRFNQSMGRNAWHNIRTNTHKKGQKHLKTIKNAFINILSLFMSLSLEVLVGVSGVTLMPFCLFIPCEMCSGLVVLAHKVSEVKKYQKTEIFKNLLYFFSCNSPRFML